MFGLSKRVRALEEEAQHLRDTAYKLAELNAEQMGKDRATANARLDALATELKRIADEAEARLATLESGMTHLDSLTAPFADIHSRLTALESAKPAASQPTLPKEILGAIAAMSHGNGRLQQQLERDARLMLRGQVSADQVAAQILAGDMT